MARWFVFDVDHKCDFCGKEASNKVRVEVDPDARRSEFRMPWAEQPPGWGSESKQDHGYGATNYSKTLYVDHCGDCKDKALRWKTGGK